MQNSFTITIDKTLEEIQDAYRTHFKIPTETKVIKRDLNKLLSELCENGIDVLNEGREDDAELDTW